VPPLDLTCAGPDLVSPSELELPGDGTAVVPVEPSEAGRLEYTVQVEDAEDLVSPPVLTTLLVEPALNSSFEETSSLNATGANVSLAGSVTAGVAPFVWSVVPSIPAIGSSVASGVLGGPGDVEWSATYRLEGSVTVHALVSDAAGGLVEDVLDAPAIPALSISVASPPNRNGSTGTLALDLSIQGGLPPFNVTTETPNGEGGWRVVAADGTVVWQLTTSATGSLPVTIVVRDSAGGDGWANTTVSIPGPAPSVGGDPASPVAWGVAAIALLVVIVVIAGIWARRRRRPEPTATPADPVAVLRAILTPADGAERTAIELLAEEEGVPLENARSALDQLIAQGKVRSEIDSDGIELLSWVREARP
jgi:hypothetical protein